jgi:ABC-2 type transport system permease protein
MSAPTPASTVPASTAPASQAPASPAPAKPSLLTRALDLVATEWIKLRSVRSTYWALLVTVVTPIAVASLVAFAFASAPHAAGHQAAPPPDPLLPELISLEYAVIAVSVLGVLAFTAEYSTGLIRVTFTAAPRRRAVLAAKAAVLAAVMLVVGEAVAFASFGLSQAVLAGHGDGVSLGHPGVPGAVLCTGLLLAVCALLGLALGAIVRHTAGGIAATIAVIVIPGIVALLPSPWSGRIGRFTLLEAARQVSALHPATNLFSPAWSLLIVLAWPAVALAAAAVLITRRDA